MSNRRKKNASTEGGAHFTKLAGGVKGQTELFHCDVEHTSKLKLELQANGIALSDTSGATQHKTLIEALEYLGGRGMNTLEGVACGFYRIATRIHELEAKGWVIVSRRESLIGADGLAHKGIARYILLGGGPGTAIPQPQGFLDLGQPC